MNASYKELPSKVRAGKGVHSSGVLENKVPTDLDSMLRSSVPLNILFNIPDGKVAWHVWILLQTVQEIKPTLMSGTLQVPYGYSAALREYLAAPTSG